VITTSRTESRRSYHLPSLNAAIVCHYHAVRYDMPHFHHNTRESETVDQTSSKCLGTLSCQTKQAS
jgi:hypothetical protein